MKNTQMGKRRCDDSLGMRRSVNECIELEFVDHVVCADRAFLDSSKDELDDEYDNADECV